MKPIIPKIRLRRRLGSTEARIDLFGLHIHRLVPLGKGEEDWVEGSSGHLDFQSEVFPDPDPVSKGSEPLPRRFKPLFSEVLVNYCG